MAEKTAEQNFTLVQTRKYENAKANATEFAEAKTKHTNAIINRLQAEYEYIFRMKIIKYYQGSDISRQATPAIRHCFIHNFTQSGGREAFRLFLRISETIPESLPCGLPFLSAFNIRRKP